MSDWPRHVRDYATAHPWLPITAALLALVVLVVLARIAFRAARGAGRDRVISTLINVAALMATGVQATGMWKFFGTTMGLPVGFRVFLFSFMEIALLACGLRARANVEDGGDAGIDGVLVWVLAIASGLMSATDANSPQEAVMRVLVSVVVALLWTRDLMAAKQGARKTSGLGRRSERVRWRFGVGSLGVKLGLADATDHGLADRDANRRIDAFVLAAHTANHTPAGGRAAARANRKKARAHAKLMRHARLHADPTHLMGLLGQAAFAEALDLLGIEPESDVPAPAAAIAATTPTAVPTMVPTAAPGPAANAADAESVSALIEAEQGAEAEAPMFLPMQRAAAAASRPNTVAVMSLKRTTAVAGTLKSAKDQLFAALDDLHARGDDRVHSGDARDRNAAALEIADRLGHPASPSTIRKHASEWAKVRNPQPAD